MKILPKFFYFVCFLGLAVATALALDRVVQPSMSTLLLRAVVAATIAGAPGLVYRKLWPLGIVLLPLGAYLLLRTTMPVPTLVEGAGGQYYFYLEALRTGVTTYITKFFPLTLADAPELRLLLAVSVYWMIGLAAFLALSLRKAVPALVLTLVLLGFSLTVDSAPRVLWLALVFLILAACLLVFSRGIERARWRLRDVLAGGAVGVVAIFLALALLGAAPSAVATPWQDWRAWDPFRQNGSVYSFNWLQNYPGLLDPGKNVAIMRVESPAPSYWRANALDTFTGSAWVTSQTFPMRIAPVQTGSSFEYSVTKARPTPAGQTVTEVFQVQSVYTNYLFAGGDPLSLSIDQELALRMNDMRALHVNKALGPSLEYTLTAVIPELKPTDLVGLGADYPETVNRYLALPFPRAAEISGTDKEAAWRSMMPDTGPDGWEWVGLYALNEQIVGDATDPYDITLRVERYLRSIFDYSLAPPPSDYSSPYAAFLFDTRSGYCQHFAGAMALLLRYNGVPARVAVGFATGEPDGPDAYLVSTNNAHAWVEVYFPGVGWVAFDPTPGRSIPTAGASSTSPGFINPFVDTSPSEPGTLPTQPQSNPLPEGVTGQETGGAGTQGWLSNAAWLPWVAGLVVVLAGWPIARGLWRRRRLRRGPLERRLQASLHLLRAELSDYGAVTAPSLTLEEVVHILYVHLGIDPDLALVYRADAVLFGGRPATQADVDQAEALRREVKTRLRKRHGWVRTGFGVVRRAAIAVGNSAGRSDERVTGIRGLGKIGVGADGTAPPGPPRCAAMAVGSLPCEDPQQAMELILRWTPEIPAWPQLPRRSFLENMYVQYAEGFPGAVVETEQQRFYVTDDPPADEVAAFLEKLEQDDPALFAISPDRAAGIPALQSALRARTEAGSAPPFVKGQVTGPVSFGLTILREDRRGLLFDDTQRELATALLTAKARWQQDLLRLWSPTSVPVIVFDEPYMAQLGSAFVNVPPELCYPLLEECLAPLDCLTGIHICGGADWESVISLPFDLLSFDAADYLDSVITQREAFAAFAAEGGLLAWGAVPNDDRALTLEPEEIARRILTGAEALEKTGALSIDEVLASSFVSPACGTGALSLEVAERCFSLSSEASAWLRARS